MLDCTCECHADIEDCSQCCFKHKLIENAKRENAALYERIGILGECLHVMSKNMEAIEKIRSITIGFVERVSDIEEQIKKLQEAYHAKALNGDELKELLENLPLLALAAMLTIGMVIIHDCMCEANDEIGRLN